MDDNNYLQYEESVCSEAVTSSCTDKVEQYKLWYSVFNAGKKIGYTLGEREERIVVSTLCYAVYDLMVDKVKDYKVEQMLQTEITATATAPSTSGASRIKLRERYEGFALHSMISEIKPSRSHHKILHCYKPDSSFYTAYEYQRTDGMNPFWI